MRKDWIVGERIVMGRLAGRVSAVLLCHGVYERTHQFWNSTGSAARFWLLLCISRGEFASSDFVTMDA